MTNGGQEEKRLRIAVVLGKLGAAVHGTLDVAKAFDDEEAFVTGTVGGFLNIVWGLAERGHHVDAFCDAKEKISGCRSLAGANVYKFDQDRPDESYDAYLSVLEPDILRTIPSEKTKILVQWLNDFSYCRPGHEKFVDVYVSPSETHKNYLLRTTELVDSQISVIPLSINPELHVPSGPRRPFSMAYSASPDRGLHHLLEWWPEIRRLVPEANLRVYYRVLPWCDDILREPSQRGSQTWRRAKLVRDTFADPTAAGARGLTLVGPLPQRKLMRELATTRVFAYPCDPVRFTEGFSVSVLDACAAGCVPVISGVDAFPELWWNAACVIPGHPADGLDKRWVETLVRALTDDDFASEVRTSAKARSRQLTRGAVSLRWEELIKESVAKKKKFLALQESTTKSDLTDQQLISLVFE